MAKANERPLRPQNTSKLPILELLTDNVDLTL